ncbi:MAG: NADH-quinone oxidoreductase subunit L [Candidatus Margulisiibacteriota bacterium]
MKPEILLLIAIFAPLLGAFLLPVMGKLSPTYRNLLALLLAIIPCAASLALLPSVLAGQSTVIHYSLPLSINFSFNADALAVFMASVSSFLSAIIVLYSFGYINHYENQNEYYFLVVLFLGAMMGLVYSANLIFLFAFWEITAIACWRLIGFFREKEYVQKADKAFLITVFGALVMLIGFIILFQLTGSFDLQTIKKVIGNNPVPDIVVLLILFGILSKSATLPFHTWLPDAGVAPSPVTALLHAAVLVKIGVYVFARLFVATMPISVFWHVGVPAIAAASALLAAGAALVETDLKRIIAYSTISQLGFIFLGLATNCTIGIAGGLLYILMHGLAKGGLFLCAGIVEQNTKTKDIRKLSGLISSMPITAIAFLLCAFSIMGIPPFGGFFSKYMVIAGSAQGEPLWITLLFIFGAVMTIIYLFRVFNAVFLGNNSFPTVKEGSATMLFSVALLAALSLIIGFLIYYPGSVVQIIAQSLPGIIK